MGKYGDLFIMIVAGILLLVWIYRGFYRWLHSPIVRQRPLLLHRGQELDGDDECVKLLEDEGYAVQSGKHRVPVTIDIDGEPMKSRVYIDYIAEKDGRTYVVKTARERMPVEWTGSAVRDRFLVFALLVPYCEGILFVDTKARSIRTISFTIAEEA
ncbi:hypothetical protein JFN88_23710 [Paenibacillus sp. MAHUQ-46]|uniref:Uncharacterized protein n=1 Tax=Paenibacillus roseus TaxID=2798579 RepID=A0A934JCE4_9BACL|nr:hypothetical protein [Paenibacillus roseus]